MGFVFVGFLVFHFRNQTCILRTERTEYVLVLFFIKFFDKLVHVYNTFWLPHPHPFQPPSLPTCPFPIHDVGLVRSPI